MRYLRPCFWLSVLITYLIMVINIAYANSNPMSGMELDKLNSKSDCVEIVPSAAGLNVSKDIEMDISSRAIVPASIAVGQGKFLEIRISEPNLSVQPDKYKILYRIDPRFTRPQVFIQKYDHFQKKYIFDFNEFAGGKLPKYLEHPPEYFSVLTNSLVNYFDFKGRNKINIPENSVVSITLDTANGFFADESQEIAELGSDDNIWIVAHTRSPISDNAILYSDAAKFCRDIVAKAVKDPDHNVTLTDYEYCEQKDSAMLYKDMIKNFGTFVGNINQPLFIPYFKNLKSCPLDTNDDPTRELCLYDQARGLEIKIGGSIVKKTEDSFVRSPFSGNDFFHINSSQGGDLDFTTSWEISDMYISDDIVSNLTWIDRSKKQFMKNWSSSFGKGDWFSWFQNLEADFQKSFKMKFLHFGRYFLYVEVAPVLNNNSDQHKKKIDIEYAISTTSDCSDAVSFSPVSKDIFRTNADIDGYLCLRIANVSQGLAGIVPVSVMAYTGSTIFSRLIYTDIILRLREVINGAKLQIYNGLATSPQLSLWSKILLSIYISIYAALFTIGAMPVTVKDLLSRIGKVALIATMFSADSWDFFDKYLFRIFMDGTDSLINSVVGVTSSANNPFAFIDTVFSAYLSGNFWTLLLAQFFAFTSGLTIIAIMIFFGIFEYVKAILELIVTYCLAMVIMSVMISIAPLLFLCMLFEHTRSIFDNWLSLLLHYLLKPFILIVIFLLIEQAMSNQISQAVTSACWKTLLETRISLDLSRFGIDKTFFIDLPKFLGIPFYSPVIESTSTLMRMISSSIIFVILSKITKGLPEFVDNILQNITQIQLGNDPLVRSNAQKQNPGLQGQSVERSMPHNVSKTVSRPVTKTASAAGKILRDKVIGQKIDHNNLDASLGR